MRKTIWSIILLIVILMCALVYWIKMSDDVTKESFYVATTFSKDDNRFEITLSPNAVTSVGSTELLKGDQMTITFDKYNGNADLSVALTVPIDETSYEEENIDEQAVKLKADEQCMVTLTSPKNAKYGVRFINNSDEKLTFRGYTDVKIVQIP